MCSRSRELPLRSCCQPISHPRLGTKHGRVLGRCPVSPWTQCALGSITALSLEKPGWSESDVEHLLLNSSTEHVFKHRKEGVVLCPFPVPPDTGVLVLHVYRCAVLLQVLFLSLPSSSTDVLGASFTFKATRF